MKPKQTSGYTRPPKKSKKGWIIILVVVVLAYIFWPAANSTPDPRLPVTYITVAEIRANPFIIIDVRSKDEYDAGHYTRAINVTKEDLVKKVFFIPSKGLMSTLGEFIEGYNVIVYGDPDDLFETESVARTLQLEKVKNVKVYKGSYEDLQKEKL